MIEVTLFSVSVAIFCIIGMWTTIVCILNAICWLVDLGNALIKKYKNK